MKAFILLLASFSVLADVNINIDPRLLNQYPSQQIYHDPQTLQWMQRSQQRQQMQRELDMQNKINEMYWDNWRQKIRQDAYGRQRY